MWFMKITSFLLIPKLVFNIENGMGVIDVAIESGTEYQLVISHVNLNKLYTDLQKTVSCGVSKQSTVNEKPLNTKIWS